MAMTGARTAPIRHIRCFNRAIQVSWFPGDILVPIERRTKSIGARGYAPTGASITLTKVLAVAWSHGP
jgi:hypothetical protein